MAGEEVAHVVEKSVAEAFGTEMVGEEVCFDQQASIVDFEIVFEKPLVKFEESKGIDFGKIDRIVAGRRWSAFAAILSDEHVVLVIVVHDRDRLSVDLGFEPPGFVAEEVGKDVFLDGISSRRDDDGDGWTGAESVDGQC